MANAIPFASLNDPRVPVTKRTTAGQDGQTVMNVTSIYLQLTNVDIVNGLDARLIEAEKALRDDNLDAVPLDPQRVAGEPAGHPRHHGGADGAAHRSGNRGRTREPVLPGEGALDL